MQNHIDFIEGQPVCHIIPVPFHQHLAQTEVVPDHLPAPPAPYLTDQSDGTVKMTDRHQGPDPIFSAFLKNLLIKPQPLFIRLRFISLRENTGPGNTQPVGFKSHLTKEPDVLPEVMIHVNRFRRRIPVGAVHGKHFPVPGKHGAPIRPRRAHIHICQSSSAFKYTAFTLVCRRSAAP